MPSNSCFRGFVGVLATAAALASLVHAPVSGQAPTAYTPPPTSDGQPDLQGVWQVLNSAVWDLQDHEARLGVSAGQSVVEGNVIPYQPWALAKKQENFASRQTADPEGKCYMPGVPRITYTPFPFEIHQFPGKVVIIYEYLHIFRTIYTDGSQHPPGHIDWWMGDSRARWEGNTLVVSVRHLTGDNWLDRAGNFYSENVQLTERYTRTGPDHMLYEVTVEDPTVYTRPWKISMPLYRRQEPNIQILEYECHYYLEEEKERLEEAGVKP